MKKKLLLLFFIFIFLGYFVFSAGEETNVETGESVFEDIGTILDSDLEILAKGVDFFPTKNENILRFTAEDATLKIGEDYFKDIDIDKIAYIKIDSKGEILEADLTASEDTIFTFDETNYNLVKGQRIKYNGGKIEVFGEGSFEYKEKDSDLFTKIDFLKDSIVFEKDETGDYLITGDFKIGDNKIQGLYGNKGKATLSKEGMVSELWKNTKATIKGIECSVSGENVKISYDKTFDLSNCDGNCFNYGKEKISLKGHGFQVDLKEKNSVFGDMKTKKYISGQKEPKIRNLKLSIEDGFLEINKNNKNGDLAFNIIGEGRYSIDNGRTIIYSDNLNGLEKNKIFVKTNIKNDLIDSYDLNLNKGKYVLEENLFKDSKGNIIVNSKTPWENTAYKRKISKTTKKEIWEIESITGKGTFRDWSHVLKDQEFDKISFKAAESANKNKKGIKISPEEFAAFVAHEGWFFESYDNRYTSKWEQYKEDPNQKFRAGGVGLTYINDYIDQLKKDGFIPKEASINYRIVSSYGEKVTEIDGRYLPEIFAGTIAYFKSKAKKAAGEEWERLKDDEKIFLTTYAFNSGHPYNGKISSVNIEEGYKGGRVLKNAAIRRAIYLDFKRFFSFP